MSILPERLTRWIHVPLLERVAFHARRVGSQVDRHFFITLLTAVAAFVVVATLAVTLLEKQPTLADFGSSLHWAVTTVIGSGDPNYVTSPGGFVVGWLLAFFGVALVATMTAAIVGFVIDFLLKEGQGMGAAGYRDHIVICGWSTTARDLVEELQNDEYQTKVVLLHDADRNPAGDGVYFVHGDITSESDLRRAGIERAATVIVFPSASTNDADMRSILAVMAVKAVAPEVRTVVEANNPAHAEHFRRAKADEILVTSRLASRLLARSALYPGLTDLVSGVVSNHEPPELYRVALPDDYCGISVDQLSAKLRGDHQATLVAINRHGESFANPPSDFTLQPGDDAVVLAQGLGALRPLQLQHE